MHWPTDGWYSACSGRWCDFQMKRYLFGTCPIASLVYIYAYIAESRSVFRCNHEYAYECAVAFGNVTRVYLN